MRYINSEEVREIEMYIAMAAEEAKKSGCSKSKRGSVIVKEGKIIGRGYNKPTLLELCDPCIRRDINDKSRVELCSAIHAEQMAILDAVNSGRSLKGARLYHIKVENGGIKPSDDISCTVCSRIILVSGIEEVVLWHTAGYAVYGAEEFNRLSFEYFLGK